MARGLACVASAYDGQGFNDPYLRFVYPGEALDSPAADSRVTYRLLDAYFILLMLREAGVNGGPAAPAFERAEAVTSALAAAWRDRPIYNLRKDPRPEGIALDTYAILAYLRHDVGMSRVVLDGLDGDGWLPANYYTGKEWFRLFADESWAARAVASAAIDPEAGRGAILRVATEGRARLKRPTDFAARAILVVHVLEALRDLPPPTPARGGSATDAAEDLRAYFVGEAILLLRRAAADKDTLILANLVGSLAAEPEVAARDLARGVAALAQRQDAAGCWSPSTDAVEDTARIFTTMRCLLAQSLYRKHRAGAAPGALHASPT